MGEIWYDQGLIDKPRACQSAVTMLIATPTATCYSPTVVQAGIAYLSVATLL